MSSKTDKERDEEFDRAFENVFIDVFEKQQSYIEQFKKNEIGFEEYLVKTHAVQLPMQHLNNVMLIKVMKTVRKMQKRLGEWKITEDERYYDSKK